MDSIDSRPASGMSASIARRAARTCGATASGLPRARAARLMALKPNPALGCRLAKYMRSGASLAVIS